MNDTVTQYSEQFAALSPVFSEGEPDWMTRQRGAAMDSLRQTGFPGQRDEDWRYMPLRPLTARAFDTDITDEIDDLPLDHWLIPGLESHRFVFVDGVLNDALSSNTGLPPGISVRSLASVLRQGTDALPGVSADESLPDNGFLALNAAFFRDGYLVDLDIGLEADSVLEFLFVSAGKGKVGQARNILRLGPNARVKVVERHVSLDGLNALVNTSTRVVLEAGASLHYHLVETMGRGTSMINDVVVDQSRDSNLQIMTATLGGDVVRNNLKVRLNGPGAHCELLGMYAATGRQHVDNHTGVVHAAPHCSSRELYKGVLDKRSRGVFHGRIRVDQGAVKTDADQTNDNLLLSPDAEIDTKPQLEIYADDVKCAHGATVGQLDANALFYLRSRGIDPENARSLLTYGFVNDVLGDVEVEPLRDFLAAELSRRLISHE